RGDRKKTRKKSDPFANNKVKGDRPDYEKSEKLKQAEQRYSDKNKTRTAEEKKDAGVRLNKYIANAGICSRREADKLIAAGDIKVNKKVVTEMGYKVQPGDKVTYKGRGLKNEKPVYVLLNKPKDFITTTDDPHDRRTVMDLVKQSGDERIFPIGRLDRQTTGLLLLTNDGELAEKLAHPSNNIKKVYQVDLDKPITENDFLAIQEGIKLDDGQVEVDEVVVLDKDRQILGLEIHIGRNRIVRRLFEHLGYTVVKLDRVFYAGLTKKDLPRGKWRYLSEKEVVRLKYLR
ncbi:MAG: pseudouridine synthase, partial [Cyclobacteriaceae bacterium]